MKSASPAARRWTDAAARILRLVAVMAALVTSLLTFPAGIPWMVAGWLLAFTCSVGLRRSGVWFLATPIFVLVIKRVDWPSAMWLLVAVMAAAITVRLARREGRHTTRRWMVIAAVWLAWTAWAYQCHRAAHANHAIAPLDDRPIVCIGDSLTSFGRAGGYPEVLATMISAPVVNLGQPGITSAVALKQLPALRAARPQAVVIELGGHDFLKDSSLLKTRSRAATKQNLVQFITAAQKLNAEVVIIEIPRAFFSDPFAGLERELAREFDLELVADTAIRELVLYSPYAPPGMWTGGPYLSEDGLHPNARGNELLARHVARALAHLYGPAVLSKGAP